MNDTLIYIFLIAMVAILVVFIGIAANRKRKGYRIIVLRDFRNPNKKRIRYLAMFDSKKDQNIKLYSNIFTPLKTKIMPPADMSGYAYDRQVFAFQGVSGHPDDDAIVFVHLPLVGRAGANEYSITISEAIQQTLDFYTEFMKHGIKDAQGVTHPIKIGDVVELDNRQYTISKVDFNGVFLQYTTIVKAKDKQGIAYDKKEVVTMQPLKDINIIESMRLLNEPDDAVSPTYASFFNTDWVMQNMGVVPVEDVNVMLATQKDYISSFNSQLHSRAMSKMGIFGRYPWLLPMAIMTFVVAISATIIWYSVTQDVGSVTNTATTAIQHILGLTKTNSTLPSPTG